MTSNLGTEFVSKSGTLGFLGAGDDKSAKHTARLKNP
jgi:hypothetical protein